MSLWPLAREQNQDKKDCLHIPGLGDAAPRSVIPGFAVTGTVAEKLWLVLLLHFPHLDGAFGDRKKIIKDHLVLKDDVLHT